MSRSIAITMNWSLLPKRRSATHVQRKLYHLVMGLICFFLYAFVVTREVALSLLAVVGGFLVLIDISRLWFPTMNRFMVRMVGRFMRREELKSISGNSFFVLGLIVIVYFFPKPIVLLSALFLAVGDPIAALVGTRYGKTKIIGNKSLEGALANWVASTVVTALFAVFYMGFSGGHAVALTLVGGLVSVAVELIPLPLDDNFTIPFFSATFLYVLNAVFGLF